jgi:hypothetical protein
MGLAGCFRVPGRPAGSGLSALRAPPSKPEPPTSACQATHTGAARGTASSPIPSPNFWDSHAGTRNGIGNGEHDPLPCILLIMTYACQGSSGYAEDLIAPGGRDPPKASSRRDVAIHRLCHFHAGPGIEVGTGHWFAPLPPPNRACRSPAHGSPVSGLLRYGDWLFPTLGLPAGNRAQDQ